jgi:hypothetical protein
MPAMPVYSIVFKKNHWNNHKYLHYLEEEKDLKLDENIEYN